MLLAKDKNIVIRPAPTMFDTYLGIGQESPGITISFMRDMNLLSNEELCANCHIPMKIKPLPKSQDNEQWRCSKCSKQLSIRNDSFWSVSMKSDFF